MQIASNTSGCRLIRRSEVERLTGLRRSQLYALIQRGAFPASVKLSERCVAWVESDVRGWIDDRISAARSGAAA